MTADELGGGVDDDVRAPFDRPAEVRAGESVVHHQRHAGVVGYLCHPLYVQDVDGRVTQRLAKEKLRLRPDSPAEVFRIAPVNETGLDPQAAQGLGKESVCATVQARRGHDVVPCFQQRQDGYGNRRLA